MILTFRPIKVRPSDWRPASARRETAPFGATYSKTLVDLEREIRHLGGRDPFLQLDLADADVRLDGALRANARPAHPGVILTFETTKLGPLTYETDRYDHWHGNLRAVALGLDCLRRVERYGIANRDQQYRGYRELGSGIELGPGTMTREQAARLIADADPMRYAADEWTHLLSEPAMAREAFRRAAKAMHPDAGGDEEAFKVLSEARRVLLPGEVAA